MAEPILKVSNIETYYGPIMAIRGVSFDVPKGSIVTILGANGAGKTTVLKTVCGVMDPQKGSVAVRGPRDPAHGSRQGDAARHQPRAGGPRGLPVPVGAREPAHGRLHAPDADGVAQDLETVFGYFPVLKERADQRAGSLSGGEQQMLAISRALMARPQAHAARRALARPVAQAGEGNLRDRRAHQPRARRHHPAGRAERQHGAADRRLRLRAGGRPHRHGRHLRAAAARRKTSRNSTSASRKRARAASGAGRSARRGGDERRQGGRTMDGYDGRIEVDGCDTIPKLFWHQVKTRDGRTALAREEARHLAGHELARVRRACPRDRHGAGQARPRARRRRVDPGRDDPGMALRRHGHRWAPAASPTASIRPTRPSRSSTSSTTAAPRFLFVENEEQLDKFLDVRERCPTIAEGLRVRHGGAGRLQRPAGDAARRADGARPRARRAPIPASGRSASRASERRGARAAGLHLGHHRAAQGRDDLAPQHHLPARAMPTPSSRSAPTTSSSPSCRSATSPSAPSPTFLPLRSGAIANFAESVETVPENVREVAPTTFFAVPRIWERFYSGIAIRMKEATWIGRTAYGWALGLGLQGGRGRARRAQALAAA